MPLDLSKPYVLNRTAEEDIISYTFITDNSIEYIIVFVNNTLQYAKEDIGDSVIFEYMFAPITSGNKPPYDDRVMATIMDSIAKTMMHEPNVVLFICDGQDSREKARAKLFDRMFNKYRPDNLVKIDGDVRSSKYSDDISYISVIVNVNNPDKDKIDYTFNELIFHSDGRKNPLYNL